MKIYLVKYNNINILDEKTWDNAMVVGVYRNLTWAEEHLNGGGVYNRIYIVDTNRPLEIQLFAKRIYNKDEGFQIVREI